MSSISTALLLLSALALSFNLAHSAVSNVLGVSEITIAKGNVPIAPAYVHPRELGFSVESTSLVGDKLTLNLSTASLSSGVYNESSLYPLYYIEVTTPGGYEGMIFDVTSNATDSVTVETWTSATQPISAGSSVIIRKHMTIDDFFSQAENQLAAYEDTLKFFTPSGGFVILFWDGSRWSVDDQTDNGNFPIYPGQGFLTIFSKPKTFNVFGEVKSTPTQVPLYVGAVNLVSTLSPIKESFNSLGVTGWMSPYYEIFKLFLPDGSLSTAGFYFYDGTKVTADFIADYGDVTLSPHSSFSIFPATDMNWPVPAAYPAN